MRGFGSPQGVPSLNKWASGFGRLRRPPTQPARKATGVGSQKCGLEESRTWKLGDWGRFGGPER